MLRKNISHLNHLTSYYGINVVLNTQKNNTIAFKFDSYCDVLLTVRGSYNHINNFGFAKYLIKISETDEVSASVVYIKCLEMSMPSRSPFGFNVNSDDTTSKLYITYMDERYTEDACEFFFDFSPYYIHTKDLKSYKPASSNIMHIDSNRSNFLCIPEYGDAYLYHIKTGIINNTTSYRDGLGENYTNNETIILSNMFYLMDPYSIKIPKKFHGFVVTIWNNTLYTVYDSDSNYGQSYGSNPTVYIDIQRGYRVRTDIPLYAYYETGQEKINNPGFKFPTFKVGKSAGGVRSNVEGVLVYDDEDMYYFYYHIENNNMNATNETNTSVLGDNSILIQGVYNIKNNIFSGKHKDTISVPTEKKLRYNLHNINNYFTSYLYN